MITKSLIFEDKFFCLVLPIMFEFWLLKVFDVKVLDKNKFLKIKNIKKIIYNQLITYINQEWIGLGESRWLCG